MLKNAPIDWLKAGSLIDQLRDDEGSCVGIYCDNGDFGPNSSITIIDDWTGWEERSFFGDSVIDALEQALAVRPKP